MSRGNRVSPSNHFLWFRETELRRLNSFVEKTTSTSPCVGQEHWAVRLRLGAVLKRSSQAAFRLSDLLFPGRVLQDWARHRTFDHISQTAGGQFGPSQICAVEGQHLPRTSRVKSTGERVPPTRIPALVSWL